MKSFIKKILKRELLKENENSLIIKDVLYHTSNPIFRELIVKDGLIPKQESWGAAIGSDYNAELGDKKVIFASNNGEHYDSTYDDDVWEIHSKLIKNKWFKDQHFDSGVYTFEVIPRTAIKLIYKGTGEDQI